MQYSIGDVARALGLTPGGLHYFEREGVIRPLKGGGTRRFYEAEDIIRLISYKKYRTMELSLKEIAQQFSAHGDTLDAVEGKLLIQMERALETARRYEALSQDIGWFTAALQRREACLGRIDVCTSPHCYTLMCGEDGFISRNREEQKTISIWLDQMPATHLSVFERPQNGACFGYSVEAARGQALSLNESPCVEERAPHIALHTMVSMPLGYYDEPETVFTTLREYLQTHGFEQAAPAMGVDVAVACANERRDTLVELWMPFI